MRAALRGRLPVAVAGSRRRPLAATRSSVAHVAAQTGAAGPPPRVPAWRLRRDGRRAVLRQLPQPKVQSGGLVHARPSSAARGPRRSGSASFRSCPPARCRRPAARGPTRTTGTRRRLARGGHRSAAGVEPDPGRTSTVHRLNRTEYRHAIRDLLALDVDVAELLPGDETSDSGFDNNGDVLSITTTQLERYMSAARKITRLAIGLLDGRWLPDVRRPAAPAAGRRQNEELPLGSRGGIAVATTSRSTAST